MNSPFQFPDGLAMPFLYDGRDRLLLPESYSPGKPFVASCGAEGSYILVLLNTNIPMLRPRHAQWHRK